MNNIRHVRAERKRRGEPPQAYVIGVNAPPGSGKGTIVQILVFLMRLASHKHLVGDDVAVDPAAEAGSDLSRAAAAAAHPAARDLRVVNCSSDDLYMGKTKREAHGLATRLDPRSLDRDHYGIVERLKNLQEGEKATIPIFSKGKDDQCEEGIEVEGPFDLVIYEGWRVGVKAGTFRGEPFDYDELNAPINYLMCVRRTHSRQLAPPKSRPGSRPRVGLRRREGSAHAGARPKPAELAP